MWNLLISALTVVLTCISVFTILITINPKFNKEWFAAYMNYVHMRIHLEPFKMLRDYMLQDLDKIKSFDPELRKDNAIRILEIGCGCGPNFRYYPNNCRLIAVDPNEAFEKYFYKFHKKFPNVMLERFVKARGEELDQHIPDESVDVIVLSHVLCSVQDQEQVLKQCHRILIKGGTLRFMEHVLHPKGSFKQIVQSLIQPIWTYFADGCCINRVTGEAIKNAGFSKLDLKYTDNINTIFPFGVISANVYGIATK